MAEINLWSLTIPKLKEILRYRGLPVSGNKAQLIERLNPTTAPRAPAPNVPLRPPPRPVPTEIRMDDLRAILQQKIERQLRADLTIGRTDEGLPAHDEKYIIGFLATNQPQIEQAIDAMLTAYADDGDLEELYNPEDDWIREFLYEYISPE